MRNVTDPGQHYEPIALQVGSGIRTIPKQALIAYGILSLAAIAILPRLIPMAPNSSDSYLFGYNNRVGILLLLISIAVAVVWTKGLNLHFLTSGESPPAPKSTLMLALLVVFCGCAFMYVFAGSRTGFGESFYLIDRTWLLSHGITPYRDIEFAYGPGLLYGPLIVEKLLPIDVAQSYFLFWLINDLLGTVLLFKAVNLVDYPTRAKKTIFLLLFCAGLFAIVRMGTNYTFLRFACPVYFVLVAQRLFKATGGVAKTLAVFACVAFDTLLLLISPELAIAFGFACVCICVFSRDQRRLQIAVSVAAMLAGFSVVFWAALKLHVLDTLIADGGGAINFPILIAPHIVVFFAALFVCACFLFQRFRDRRLADNTFGLIAFSVPMLAAALGRCDPSHVYWNGLSIFLASMCYLSNFKRAWRYYQIAFVLFSFLLPNLSELYLFGAAARQVMIFNAHKNELPERQDLGELFPSWSGPLLAPFGYRPGGVGIYESTRINFGRFEGLTDVSTRHSVDEKIAEMQEHSDSALLLPNHFEDFCQPNVHKERRYISLLLVYPFHWSPAHAPIVQQPICDYISATYRLQQAPAERTFWYGIWVRKATSQ